MIWEEIVLSCEKKETGVIMFVYILFIYILGFMTGKKYFWLVNILDSLSIGRHDKS